MGDPWSLKNLISAKALPALSKRNREHMKRKKAGQTGCRLIQLLRRKYVLSFVRKEKGIEPKSPALAGRFFTTEPPGKPDI